VNSSESSNPPKPWPKVIQSLRRLESQGKITTHSWLIRLMLSIVALAGISSTGIPAVIAAIQPQISETFPTPEAISIPSNLPITTPETTTPEISIQAPLIIGRWNTANELIEQGERLAMQGQIPSALRLFQEADVTSSWLGVSSGSWNTACWYGSLWGYADQVIDACDRAVELDPNNIEVLDSRGLARALSGNIEGAIADFSTFVETTDDANRRYTRQNWIEMLKAGENPFTPEILRMLFID
jgi:tetratricopeptide (TPR) repeat protein